MMDKSLTAHLLHSYEFLNEAVKGEPDSNNEKFLVEFLNNSSWFRNKVGSKEFVRRERQVHGECDTYAGEYELDFKLLVSATACQARRELSDSIVVIQSNATVISAPRRTKPMNAIRIYCALRGLSCEKLLSYEEGVFKYGTVEYDVQNIVEKASTQKNIVFFFPYYFTSDVSSDLEYMIPVIQEALEHDFSALFKLRKSRCPDKETYISCVCSDTMLFFQCDNDHLNYIDSVSTSESKTYTKLQRYGVY